MKSRFFALALSLLSALAIAGMTLAVSGVWLARKG